MKTIYTYVLNTMADWELSYLAAELHSGRYFKKNAKVKYQTVGSSLKEITTMGGLKVQPDIKMADMVINEDTVLLLPGSDNWNDSENQEIINIAKEVLKAKGLICAICGATVALAKAGILDNHYHTSNGVGFLDYMSPNYQGQKYYKDEGAVIDNNLITAGCTSGLLMAKLALEQICCFTKPTLDAWYNYFSTGRIEAFFALMNSPRE